jgi:hypothetical protein
MWAGEMPMFTEQTALVTLQPQQRLYQQQLGIRVALPLEVYEGAA